MVCMSYDCCCKSAWLHLGEGRGGQRGLLHPLEIPINRVTLPPKVSILLPLDQKSKYISAVGMVIVSCDCCCCCRSGCGQDVGGAECQVWSPAAAHQRSHQELGHRCGSSARGVPGGGECVGGVRGRDGNSWESQAGNTDGVL